MVRATSKIERISSTKNSHSSSTRLVISVKSRVLKDLDPYRGIDPLNKQDMIAPEGEELKIGKENIHNLHLTCRLPRLNSQTARMARDNLDGNK